MAGLKAGYEALRNSWSGIPDDVAAFKAEFEALRNAEAPRLSRYRDYRDENEAARDTQLVQFSGGDDYGQVKQRPPMRHSIPLPFGQAMTVKHAFRVAGRLPEVVVDRREESPQERYRSDAMEKMVWGMIRESKGEVQLADAAWDGSQVGASCFQLRFDYVKQMPLFKAVDPAGVLVVEGLDDPHDFQRVYRFWQVPKATFQSTYRDATFRDEPVSVGRCTVDMVTIVDAALADKYVRFALEDGIGLDERAHGYGFVPYVAIPNLGPQRRVWGWADYEFVRALVQYLPKLFGREADILRAVANGAYLEKGTGQSPETLKTAISKGSVIPSKKDGELTPVDPPSVPAFAESHADRGVEMLKMLGFSPDASWGQGITSSGTDRAQQLAPAAELAAMKQLNWGAGLSRLFQMAFRMVEAKQTGNARYRGQVVNGGRRSPFTLLIGPGLDPSQQDNPNYDPSSANSDPADEFIDVPRDPGELFDGDYDVRFQWNAADPSDPAYILAELNKFQQGAQSLQTTLEHLGCQSPEDEMKLIEQEADRFPWLRQGQIAMIRAQLAAGGGQGQGGGPSTDPGTGLDAGLGTLLDPQGASLGADAGATALNSDVSGPLYGGA